MGTVAVADVDATVARARELGGVVHMGPVDLPSVGRYAVLADPTGCTLSVMSSINPTLTMPDMTLPGRVQWNECWSQDPDAAFMFYQGLFGWVEKGSMDMGPQGTYRMFGRPEDGPAMGGFAKKMEQMPAGAWAYYITVPDVDHAANRIRESGGKVLAGPHEVPGGGRMLQAMDVQGAMFALYQNPRA